MTARYQLTHLKQLEAEAIHIIREVAAEFENPVMLYSIGKDSAVMMQLALKATEIRHAAIALRDGRRRLGRAWPR
jgi:3'-phosphoadenosine 5'-phosphosulfate sulfotransferase (PAPS reductase)/FAD synthetase